jgi:hypothetical protein
MVRHFVGLITGRRRVIVDLVRLIVQLVTGNHRVETLVYVIAGFVWWEWGLSKVVVEVEIIFTGTSLENGRHATLVHLVYKGNTIS